MLYMYTEVEVDEIKTIMHYSKGSRSVLYMGKPSISIFIQGPIYLEAGPSSMEHGPRGFKLEICKL